MTDGVGTETRGGGAKLFSQFLRLANQVVPVQDSIVVGITHLISNTSGMGAQYVERAARAWSYQCDYQFRVQSKTPWKVGERQVGLQLRVLCNTSKRVPPGRSTDVFIRFGIGSDRLYECLNMGVSTGLVRKSGAWLSLDFLRGRGGAAGEEPPKFQGIERTYQALAERQEWAKALQDEVMAVAGDVVSSGGGD
jgi:recombination protein RecA